MAISIKQIVLYEQIIEDDRISLSIKERVTKINEFEKYN